jgi:metal-responsive CopG/Arc/MetJ family transcriptional regulator
MPAAKIAITIDKVLLERLDRMVEEDRFESRSRAVQDALRDKLDALDIDRFEEELAKLDPQAEREMAEDGTGDLESWPDY